jgi:hypothetical protein
MGWRYLPTRKAFRSTAEVFAAICRLTDHEIGRVIPAVDDLGRLDNTLESISRATMVQAPREAPSHAIRILRLFKA